MIRTVVSIKYADVLDLLVDDVFGQLQVDGALDLLDKGVLGLLQ